MNGDWIEAFALLSGVHEDDFEEALAEGVDPRDATVIHYGLVRARVRDPQEDFLLLMALKGDLAQRCRVGPGRYWFPAERWPEVHEAAERHRIRTRAVPSLLYRMEMRRDGPLDALRAALLRRAPTFGPTYPRIIAE